MCSQFGTNKEQSCQWQSRRKATKCNSLKKGCEGRGRPESPPAFYQPALLASAALAPSVALATSCLPLRQKQPVCLWPWGTFLVLRGAAGLIWCCLLRLKPSARSKVMSRQELMQSLGDANARPKRNSGLVHQRRTCFHAEAWSTKLPLLEPLRQFTPAWAFIVLKRSFLASDWPQGVPFKCFWENANWPEWQSHARGRPAWRVPLKVLPQGRVQSTLAVPLPTSPWHSPRHQPVSTMPAFLAVSGTEIRGPNPNLSATNQTWEDVCQCNPSLVCLWCKARLVAWCTCSECSHLVMTCSC